MNLYFGFLEEMENIGFNLNVEGTFLPHEHHSKMVLKEIEAEKVLKNLLENKFLGIRNLNYIVSEILNEARNSTFHWSQHIKAEHQISRKPPKDQKKDIPGRSNKINDLSIMNDSLMIDALIDCYIDRAISIQTKQFLLLFEKLDLYISTSKRQLFLKSTGFVIQDLCSTLFESEIQLDKILSLETRMNLETKILPHLFHRLSNLENANPQAKQTEFLNLIPYLLRSQYILANITRKNMNLLTRVMESFTKNEMKSDEEFLLENTKITLLQFDCISLARMITFYYQKNLNMINY